MLVLARKIKQRIRIGETIMVDVLSVQGNTVTLGITADALTEVAREEVWIKKQRACATDCQSAVKD